ncbi:MAG: DUF1573 domain-containing protein [Bacteroidetes bacterium]|nr:DUF1573 domain-containing protein [Bacteroidota bacterium]MCB9226732.1 DUF1573 domain-containing protein [Chitinophagales bacterium]
MKKILPFLILFVGLNTYLFAQDGGARISFEEEKFDFGEVDEGPQVTHEFVFTNNGTEPLILSRVKASCGCTTPSWPKDPILPGDEGKILVTYNTAKRPGNFNKSITITSNAIEETTKVIYIKGTVTVAPQEETMPVRQPVLMSPMK